MALPSDDILFAKDLPTETRDWPRCKCGHHLKGEWGHPHYSHGGGTRPCRAPGCHCVDFEHLP